MSPDNMSPDKTGMDKTGMDKTGADKTVTDKTGAEQLDADIAQWRAAITRNPAIDSADADELEEHLREQAAELEAAGLTSAEAFQIAVQRMGRVDRVTAEFAREHGERLWKQFTPPAAEGPARRNRPVIEMIVFAVIAAASIQLARLLGSVPGSVAPWFVRDMSLFVFPVLIAYFAWRRRMPWRPLVALAAFVVVVAVIINLYPLTLGGQTEWLMAIHLPVLLWFAAGVAYLSEPDGTWRRRMELVRFTGEWAIYWVLLALGGGVLAGLTSMILAPIAPNAIGEVLLWVIPSGGAAAVVVAAWLVEGKKSIIENLAPVLAAVFTPLFAVMLLVAVVVYGVGGIGRNFDRDLITVFDALLIVVLGLVLYALSAREATKPAGALDVLRLVAIAAALILDLLVLVSMFGRVAEFGFTANRVAALGLNLILVANLAATAWLSVRMLAQRGSGVAMERWQTGYLPVFAAWAAVVVLILPPVFAFA